MKFITIGADPEFLVLDPKGQPYPATLFAVGTKDSPSPITSLGRGFFEQRDNLAFEGNIPPVDNREDFILSMKALRQYFENKVGRVGYSLSPNGVEYFAKRYLVTPEGMEFGCSSVIDSWASRYIDTSNSEVVSRATPVLEYKNFRVAGFHIHIGYDNPVPGFKKDIFDVLIGRLFDIFLTLPSNEIKFERERVSTYGRFGMIRSKSYGVECRSLSAYFTQEAYLGWIWDQLMKLESFINSCSIQQLIRFFSLNGIFGTSLDYFKVRLKEVIVQDIFNDNKELINSFEEIKKIYEYKTTSASHGNYGYDKYLVTTSSTSSSY